MCQECVKEEYPDRGTICLDTGAYLANLQGCHVCGVKDSLNTANRSIFDSQTSPQEVIEYDHVCGNCSHVIASHTHRFWVEEDFQYYEMSCMLCGEADDTRSCLPDDPRMEAILF
ncbi:protein Churchill [Penaeus vannamei]|uniref:Protein Churchill n=1 Tax=Penaeus vannamei TaxID=6689 RepID=A0A423SST6_PENVA|nr:protein Churchill-like [Penaeus vannamei]XP_027225618.1 protein Churchill-like [Penaeus vannamei]XP_027225619.1 protein Churchill-like [Penaeus vannamei]XP_027225620.1 protein Churchill-like [Penaeus vannamei]XP_027225621.1 protein Churchill-like [Penaeus vannamei]ROT67260.1 putative protein farnesyltransferase subunit beta isoform X3 [Penaeus vannamei]